MAGEDSDTKLREFISRFREYGASDAQIRLALASTKVPPADVDRVLGAAPLFAGRAAPSAAAAQPAVVKKRFYTQWWFFLILGFVVLGSVAGVLFASGVFSPLLEDLGVAGEEEAVTSTTSIARTAEVEEDTEAVEEADDCSSDSQCEDIYGSGYYCDAPYCYEGECGSSDDCYDIYGDGYVCVEAFCAVEEGEEGECESDTDCESIYGCGYVCDTDATCYFVGECSSDTECEEYYGEGFTCDCAYCEETGYSDTEADCADTLDDDGDGYTDCADDECDGSYGYYGETCEYGTELTCDDYSDNDGDGYFDCEDDACDSSSGYYGETCEYGTEITCDDGYDNDYDGYADTDDDDCAEADTEGEECSLSINCGYGYLCSDGTCVEQSLSESSECGSDYDCYRLGYTGYSCSVDGTCESASSMTGSFITGLPFHTSSGSRSPRFSGARASGGSSDSTSCSTTLQCRIRFGAGYECSSGSCVESSASGASGSGSSSSGTSCSSSAECSGYKCITATSTCRTRCTSDDQCYRQGGYTCSSNECVSSDSTSGSGTPECTRTIQCVNQNGPGSTCDTDSSSSTYQTCVSSSSTAGTCSSASDCTPYGCNRLRSRCRSTCTSDQHCDTSSGYSCDTSSGECESSTDGGDTAVSCTRATASVCEPYGCSVRPGSSGTCNTECTTDRQCYTDYVCDTDDSTSDTYRTCVAEGEEEEETVSCRRTPTCVEALGEDYVCDTDSASDTYRICIAEGEDEEEAECTLDLHCVYTLGYGFDYRCDDDTSTCVERTSEASAQCSTDLDCRLLEYRGYSCDDGTCARRGRSGSTPAASAGSRIGGRSGRFFLDVETSVSSILRDLKEVSNTFGTFLLYVE